MTGLGKKQERQNKKREKKPCTDTWDTDRWTFLYLGTTLHEGSSNSITYLRGDDTESASLKVKDKNGLD